MHVEQRRARLDLLGRATSDSATHVLGAIPPQPPSPNRLGFLTASAISEPSSYEEAMGILA